MRAEKIKILVVATDKKDFESFLKKIIKETPTHQIINCDFVPCYDHNMIESKFDAIMTTEKAENIIQCYLQLELGKRRNKDE